jgi:hypothetical protein
MKHGFEAGQQAVSNYAEPHAVDIERGGNKLKEVQD